MASEPAPPRRRTWLWFFVVLGVLTVAALVIPLVTVRMLHGLEPLTPERLAIARKLWEQEGPRDYDLEYRKTGSVEGLFQVQVRGGQAIAVQMGGQPLERSQWGYHIMPVMFDDLERLLEMEGKSNLTGVILRVRFNARDGHIERYIYSYTTGEARKTLEINVKLRPATPQPSRSPSGSS